MQAGLFERVYSTACVLSWGSESGSSDLGPAGFWAGWLYTFMLITVPFIMGGSLRYPAFSNKFSVAEPLRLVFGSMLKVLTRHSFLVFYSPLRCFFHSSLLVRLLSRW